MPLIDLRIVGIEYTKPPTGPEADTQKTGDLGRPGPQPGWYAVSVNLLHDGRKEWAYFLHFKPVAMAGYSIYIYHITLDEANREGKIKPGDYVVVVAFGGGLIWGSALIKW